MHKPSFEHMKNFAFKYLDLNKSYNIIDIGSVYIRNSYRTILETNNWNYTGADIVKDNNVDLLLPDLYDWKNIPDNKYDVVVSGQCLEHVQDIYRWIKEIARIVKKNGYVCIIAPWQWPEHKAPVDCWRILPDGMIFLLSNIANLKVQECFIKENDCVGIASKI